MIRRAAWGLFGLLAALRAAAQAPPEIRLEAGHAHIHQRGLDTIPLRNDAALVAAFWRLPTDRWTLLASGNLTYARDVLAAAQGVAAMAIPWTTREHLRTDFGAAGASFSLRGTGRGGNGNAFGRQHWVHDHGGAWIGSAAGLTERDGRRSHSLAIDLGGWGRYRFFYASASVARQSSTDLPLLIGSGGTASPYAVSYELEDRQLVLQLRGGPHELTGSWTRRRSIAGAATNVVAVAGSGVLQLTDRVALLLSAGRQLSDPLRGLPQADIATVSLRVSLGPKLLPVMQRSLIADAVVEPRSAGGGELRVRVFATDTLAVEVAGDFSDWNPLPLERDGNYWVVAVALPPGKYRIGVRTNRGLWRAPRNLARVRDDYGGESGLIVIP